MIRIGLPSEHFFDPSANVAPLRNAVWHGSLQIPHRFQQCISTGAERRDASADLKPWRQSLMSRKAGRLAKVPARPEILGMWVIEARARDGEVGRKPCARNPRSHS